MSQPSLESQITCWNKLSQGNQNKALPLFKEIFFLTSSRKNFSSPEEKESFWKKWVGYYFREEPESIYLALGESGRLCGYLTGSKNSLKASSKLIKAIPGYKCFEDQFVEFPAHLHINCHPNCQGQGWGRRLIDAFVTDLKKKGIPGLHLITSPGEENVHFYRHLNFSYQLGRQWKNHPLLFMGRQLK